MKTTFPPTHGFCVCIVPHDTCCLGFLLAFCCVPARIANSTLWCTAVCRLLTGMQLSPSGRFALGAPGYGIAWSGEPSSLLPQWPCIRQRPAFPTLLITAVQMASFPAFCGDVREEGARSGLSCRLLCACSSLLLVNAPCCVPNCTRVHTGVPGAPGTFVGPSPHYFHASVQASGLVPALSCAGALWKSALKRHTVQLARLQVHRRYPATAVRAAVGAAASATRFVCCCLQPSSCV